MPIYEYECSSCEKEFEELVRSSSQSVKCPACESPKVRRRLSVFAARQGQGSPAASAAAGPCGRCGNPEGSCQFD